MIHPKICLLYFYRLFFFFFRFNNLYDILLGFLCFFSFSFVARLFFSHICVVVVVVATSLNPLKMPIPNGIFNYLSCKKFNIGIIGGIWDAFGEKSRLIPCNIWKIDNWLLLKIRVVISSIHCELCDHFPCDSMCDSSLTLYPSMIAKKNSHTTT